MSFSGSNPGSSARSTYLSSSRYSSVRTGLVGGRRMLRTVIPARGTGTGPAGRSVVESGSPSFLLAPCFPFNAGQSRGGGRAQGGKSRPARTCDTVHSGPWRAPVRGLRQVLAVRRDPLVVVPALVAYQLAGRLGADAEARLPVEHADDQPLAVAGHCLRTSMSIGVLVVPCCSGPAGGDRDVRR
jgi:hypothetical protein